MTTGIAVIVFICALTLCVVAVACWPVAEKGIPAMPATPKPPPPPRRSALGQAIDLYTDCRSKGCKPVRFEIGRQEHRQFLDEWSRQNPLAGFSEAPSQLLGLPLTVLDADSHLELKYRITDEQMTLSSLTYQHEERNVA